MTTELTPHDFVKQTNSDGRVLALDDAHNILKVVKNFNGISKKYIDFLKLHKYEL